MQDAFIPLIKLRALQEPLYEWSSPTELITFLAANSTTVEVGAARTLCKNFRSTRRAALCAMRAAVLEGWTVLLRKAGKLQYNDHMSAEDAADLLLRAADGTVLAGAAVMQLAKIAHQTLITDRKKNTRLENGEVHGQTLLFVLDVVRLVLSFPPV